MFSVIEPQKNSSPYTPAFNPGLEYVELIARIDELLQQQLNTVIRHPKFQQLEAIWRGLWHLTETIPDAPSARVRIKCLTVTAQELIDDSRQANEFDQSCLFQHLYSQEFDMPGGEPFGIVLADFSISHHDVSGLSTDSISLLQMLSGIAAAAFCPIFLMAAPRLFGLDTLSALEKPIDIPALFKESEYQRWNRLRQQPDTRFLGLMVPRILLRAASSTQPNTLWGHAGFSVAAQLLQAFARNGWFLSHLDADFSQVDPNPATASFSTPRRHFPKITNEVCLTDEQEQELNELGLIVHRSSPLWGHSAIYALPSIKQAPPSPSKAPSSGKLSVNLRHLLCAARFAHHLKIMIREQSGSWLDLEEGEQRLQEWLLNYCASSTPDRLTHPLKTAKVRLTEVPGKIGHYGCNLRLVPHLPFDALAAEIQLNSITQRGE